MKGIGIGNPPIASKCDFLVLQDDANQQATVVQFEISGKIGTCPNQGKGPKAEHPPL